MSRRNPRAEQLRILKFWWTLELFSPQSVPDFTRRPHQQVIEWKQDAPLPWQILPEPEPINGKPQVWRHTVYLGIYKLEATYGSLARVFGEDADAYDRRRPGESACAGLVIDQDGSLVTGSAVLSSALWAVGRSHDPGPRNPQWMNGFDEGTKAFVEAIDEYEADRRDAVGSKQPPPVDAAALTELLRIAHTSAGVTKFPDLATSRIVVASKVVPRRSADESPDTDFLNSFYLDDLAQVRDQIGRGHLGQALAGYLTSERSLSAAARVDVVADPGVVDAGTAVERLPKGRWPANPAHGLALSQQFAVNRALAELGPAAGLMGVNGPPGTGKTTMLRDVLAGNVVERARQLAALAQPEHAFTEVTHRWKSGDGYIRKVRQLRPALTGFEMVVASANNAAVENVTVEVPARNAIDELWRESADYFGRIATEVLRARAKDADAKASVPPPAWGLVAARLGKKSNRSAFRDSFWFDKAGAAADQPSDEVPRMQTRLTQWRDGRAPRRTWTHARATFARAEQRVDTLIEQRRQAQDRLLRMPQLAERERAVTETIRRTRLHLERAEQELAGHLSAEHEAGTHRGQALAKHDRHLAAKPGALEIIFTLGRAIRAWRAGFTPLSQALQEAEQQLADASALVLRKRETLRRDQEALSAAEDELTTLRQARAELKAACAEDEKRFGKSYPGVAWTGDQRELHAPWLDKELDTARSELFLAALQLHQDFFANAASDMLDGLRAAVEVVGGVHPPGLEQEKLRAAWQLFFLVVPLVSTTFASVSRMFTGVGPEAIGWLLIDEAGQASPQYAVGAIWRARRVLAVGDPLQLEPVVTIPFKAQSDIAAHYGISDTWIPPGASVQTLADRVTTVGTTLDQGEKKVWVSAPLRVHRRCDEPMFGLCNEIAYNGIMVNGVHRKLEDPTDPDRFDGPAAPVIAPSFWADEPADTPGTHLQPNQLARLEQALAYLKAQGVDESEVIAISPFRAVADQLRSLAARHRGLRAGTIHTAQGREAPVVILVLGGDPTKPGAPANWARTPNLVNVAASRAQRRLYVIGDLAAWAGHRYFRELAAALKDHKIV